MGAGLVVVALASVALWRRTPGHDTPSAPAPLSATATNQVASPAEVASAPPAGPPQPQPEALTNDFALLPFRLEKTPGSSLVHVTGLVRNLGPRQRFGVKIEFGLFDTNDHPVGVATDYQPMLEPHAEWRFKALVMATKAASAQFVWIAEDQ